MKEEVRNELQGLFDADKAMRTQIWSAVQAHGPSSPECVAARQAASVTTRRNTARLIEIVEQHGWPGRSLVGSQACTEAFLILQHADLETQLRYVPLIRKAVDAGDVEKQDLALLEDRIRVKEGKPQLYGSQLGHGADGNPELYPIEDAEHVDELRARVGLPPLAEYLQRVGLGHLNPGESR